MKAFHLLINYGLATILSFREIYAFQNSINMRFTPVNLIKFSFRNLINRSTVLCYSQSSIGNFEYECQMLHLNDSRIREISINNFQFLFLTLLRT